MYLWKFYDTMSGFFNFTLVRVQVLFGLLLIAFENVATASVYHLRRLVKLFVVLPVGKAIALGGHNPKAVLILQILVHQDCLRILLALFATVVVFQVSVIHICHLAL